MARRPRVALHDPAADRLRPLPLLAIAAAGLCAGVASAYGLAQTVGAEHVVHAAPDVKLAEDYAGAPDAGVDGVQLARGAGAATATAHPEGEPSSAAAATTERPDGASVPARVEAHARAADAARFESALIANAVGDAAAAQRGDAPGGSTPDGVDAGSALPVDGLADAAATSAAPQPATAAAERFVRGRIAYLRCDGVSQREGPVPCPRDRVLERRVWRALETLAQCPALAAQRGHGEVRLEFTRGRTSFRVEDGPLDPALVGACAGARLKRLWTVLRPTRMIVSFRFELR